MVDVESADRAIEIAAQASAAPGPRGIPIRQPVEVREVLSAPDADLLYARPPLSGRGHRGRPARNYLTTKAARLVEGQMRSPSENAGAGYHNQGGAP